MEWLQTIASAWSYAEWKSSAMPLVHTIDTCIDGYMTMCASCRYKPFALPSRSVCSNRLKKLTCRNFTHKASAPNLWRLCLELTLHFAGYTPCNQVRRNFCMLHRHASRSGQSEARNFKFCSKIPESVSLCA